jgi:hypothetical protein
MEDTMRDLLSKLDAIVSETELKNPEDLQAKRKALQDLQLDPVASSDPEIKQAIIQRTADLEKEAKAKGFNEDIFEIGDEFGISFSEDHEIATTIVDILEDGIVIELDDAALGMLSEQGIQFLEGELVEGVAGPKSCWKGYRKVGTKPGTGKNAGKRVNDCEKISEDHYMPPDHPANKSEYDDEGGMAKDQMRMINDAAQELYKLLDAEENLPEWVQKKIVLAVDYLDTARDYMKAKKYGDDLDEYFQFEFPKGKDRGPRDHGTDELERREKSFRKHELAKDGRDYKDAMSPKSKSPFKGKYNIAGPKGKLPEDSVDEAEYQGRKVPLGKPMAGDVKKSKVYVKNPQGNVVKVNFGDKKMRIKKSNPNRRKSFRARHNCANPGPRHKARYWSCRAW